MPLVVWEDRELWTTFLCVDGGLSQMALKRGGCCDDLAIAYKKVASVLNRMSAMRPNSVQNYRIL